MFSTKKISMQTRLRSIRNVTVLSVSEIFLQNLLVAPGLEGPFVTVIFG